MTNLEIQAFLTTVEFGNLSDAAKALYVSQPALSRRISALEAELGFSLLTRSRGKRSVQLTEPGKAFISVARKWQMLWKETLQAGQLDSKNIFYVSGVGSVLSFLAPFFQEFIQSQSKSNPHSRLNIGTMHSYEAFTNIEKGIVDLALITDAFYSPNVETRALYREPMRLVTAKTADLPDYIEIEQLNAADEIRTPWSREFDSWHDYWFGSTSIPRFQLDQIPIIEQFVFSESYWAMLPVTIANKMLEVNPTVSVHRCVQQPPDRTIYALLGHRRKAKYSNAFLELLVQYISRNPDLTLIDPEEQSPDSTSDPE